MSKNPAGNAVATKPATPLAVVTEGFDQHAGAGFEGTGRDDMAIPFLSILQGLSPEIKRSEGAYIEGALEGMVLNTVTRAVIDTSKQPLVVIPCVYNRSFVEWRLREKGGGFVAEHPSTWQAPAQMERDDRGRDILPNGNQLNDTRTFYVLVLGEDGIATPAVLAMTSTQIKKAKQWLMQQNMLKLRTLGTEAKTYTPPMFASKWTVETVPESNQKGSWFGWKFTHAGYLRGASDPLFQMAIDFRNAVASGAAKADLSRTEPEPRSREPGEDDDITF